MSDKIIRESKTKVEEEMIEGKDFTWDTSGTIKIIKSNSKSVRNKWIMVQVILRWVHR